MPSGKPGTRKPKPPDLRESPAKGKPLDGSKNPGGRPPWSDDEIEAMAERMLEWAQAPRSFYLAQFCKQERTYKQKISELAEKNEKFSEILKAVKDALEANIGTAVCDGLIPPAVGVFGLKQHGHTDKQEIAHSGEIAQTHRYEMPHKRVIE